MTKKLILLLALALTISFVNAEETQQLTCPQAPAQQECPQAKECEKAKECEDCDNFLCNMGRGLVNVVTGVCELPRLIIIRNNEFPVFGFVGGACEGVGFTFLRVFAGATDVILFGTVGNNIYTQNLPEYVWQASWKAHKFSAQSCQE